MTVVQLANYRERRHRVSSRVIVHLYRVFWEDPPHGQHAEGLMAIAHNCPFAQKPLLWHNFPPRAHIAKLWFLGNPKAMGLEFDFKDHTDEPRHLDSFGNLDWGE